MKTREPDERLMTEEDVADLLATSVRHIRGLRETRAISFVRVGKSPRFRRSDIDAYLSGRVVGTRPQR